MLALVDKNGQMKFIIEDNGNVKTVVEKIDKNGEEDKGKGQGSGE